MIDVTFGEHTYSLDVECKGREGWRRYQAYGRIVANMPDTDDPIIDYDSMVKILGNHVVSWTREGDPADPAAWEDTPSPIMWALCNQILTGIRETRKNSPTQSM